MPQKKGCIPWNKGLKGIQKAWNKGKKLPEFSGEKSKNWKGGRYETQGYVFIYSPNHPRVKNQKRKYVFEHILVIEKKIGRFLKNNEVVHHINGIRNDNKINNLILFTRAQHMKFHNPLQYRTSEDMMKHRICSICNEKHWAKGYCKKHYKQNLKQGIIKVKVEVGK